MTTTEFPKEKVIGRRFEAQEGRYSYRGIIADVLVEPDRLTFKTRDIEEERPQYSNSWVKSDDGSFSFNEPAGGGTWRYDRNGNIAVYITYIGSFTIFLS
jgi:hypothetical protein